LFSQSRPLYCKQQLVTLSFSRSHAINRANHPTARPVAVGPHVTLVARAVSPGARNSPGSHSRHRSPADGSGSGGGGGAPDPQSPHNKRQYHQKQPQQHQQQQQQQLPPHSHQPQDALFAGPSPPLSSCILLLSIANPVYSITCDVLHQIMSPYGNVLRIVIFMKNGLHAMVEFDNEQSAGAAQRALDGRDIYEGSCTLKIVLSHTETLNIKHNDERQRDYTRPDLPTAAGAQLVPFGVQMMRQAAAGASAGGAPLGGVRTVVVVHGVRADLTSDQVFNIFANFGNVVRVKQLPSKPNVRLVQFADALCADAAVRHLNNALLFDTKLDVRFSVHPTIIASPSDVADPANSAYRDYTNSPLNRFRRHATPNAKNYCAPNETLHFANLPPESNEESCFAIFAMRGAPPPVRALLFDTVTTTQRSGLVEFRSATDAMTAVVLCNNIALAQGIHFKLSFTSNHIKAPYNPPPTTTTTTADNTNNNIVLPQ
jgi:polypyrimidine tract-binding protein 2